MTSLRGPISSCTVRPTASMVLRHGAPGRAERPEPFTQTVDARTGTIHGRGRLDVRAADLLSGPVAALQSSGLRRIVVDLGGVRLADDAARRSIGRLRERSAARGRTVIVVRAPWSDVATGQGDL